MTIRKHEKKDGGWCSRVVRERYGVGVWKAIRCGWEAFNSRIKGNGQRVKFWKDKRCSEFSLGEAFPTIFSIVTTKDAWIVEVWKQEGKRGCRNPHFSR